MIVQNTNTGTSDRGSGEARVSLWALYVCCVVWFVFVVILRLTGFVSVVAMFDVVIAVLMSAVLVDDDDVVSRIGFACIVG